MEAPVRVPSTHAGTLARPIRCPIMIRRRRYGRILRLSEPSNVCQTYIHLVSAYIDLLYHHCALSLPSHEVPTSHSMPPNRTLSLSNDVFLHCYSLAHHITAAGNDLVQEATCHFRQADISSASLDVDLPVDKQRANQDYRALVSSLSTSLFILWSTTASKSSGVFSDFASFMCLALADAAESLPESTKSTAGALRTRCRCRKARGIREAGRAPRGRRRTRTRMAG